MRFSNKRALAFLVGFGTLGAAGLAHADLVAPFSTAITVDPQYVTGANAATDIAWAGDGRAVVTTKGGTIYIRATNGTKTMVANPFPGLTTTSEQGLLGVVADPAVATNNTFYFFADNGPTADKHRVFKATLAANNTLTVDMTTPVIAESRNNGPGLEGPANHDGGGLMIHQNHLYISVGDTGHNATPPTNKYGSCLNKGNGKILRVNLDGSIPTDNPLASETMVTGCDTFNGAWTTAAPDRRIYAWGFRNPWRFWVDPHTGLLWIGDVGETTKEEISVGGGNQHYGWPFNEGTTPYANIDGKNCNTAFTPGRACVGPVHEYQHQQGDAVMGGLIPEGCGWTAAFGGRLLYLFAEFSRGYIRGLEVNPDRMGVTSATASTPVNLGTFTGGPVSFRMGPDQSLYVVFNGAGAVYRFTPNDRTGTECSGTGGMGGGGPGGAGGRGGAGAGGRGAGAGGTSAAVGGSGVDGGVGGIGTGGQAGAVGPGGSATGGSTAGTGTTSGGVGPGTGGATSGGVGPNGGAPVGGAPSGGGGATTGGGPAPSDDGGGCGCRAAKGSGAGYLALATGFLLMAGARFRRRRGGN